MAKFTIRHSSGGSTAHGSVHVGRCRPGLGYAALCCAAVALWGCTQVERMPLSKGVCADCHADDRSAPEQLDHLQDGFPMECETCHPSETQWKPATFDHSAFQLSGGHAAATCGQCHSQEPVPTTCVGCHADDRSRPTAPNHLASGFSTTCNDCHTTTGWMPASLDHSAFQLSGGHAAVSCEQCHDQEPVPTTCVGCHDDDRSRPSTPNHLASGFSTTCDECHTINGWTPANLDHSAFQLDGAHATASCEQCHDQEPVPTTCVGCHDDDRSRPSAPNHLAAGFSTDCSRCHAPTGWEIANLACDACHGSSTNDAPPKALSGQTTTTVRGVGAHQAHLGGSNWHVAVACTDCHRVPSSVDQAGHNDTATPAELTFSAAVRRDGANPAWNGTTCNNTYCHGATLSGGAHTAPRWTTVDGTQSACGSCHGMPPTRDHTNDDNCVACHAAVVDASRRVIAPNLHMDGTVQATSGHPAGFGAGNVHGPAFYQNAGGCSDCHGATLEGGSARSCQGGGCHTSGWKQDCTFCHGGGDSQNGAPPAAVDGATSTSDPGVGRHSSHTLAGSTHAAFPCTTCHRVPTDALSAGHVGTAPADLSFSALASGSSYSASTRVCSNVYCHGNGRGGGGSATWTGSLSGGCSACHDSPPRTGEHRKHVNEGIGCATCHSCVANDSQQITNAARHVDGTIDVCGPSGWRPSSQSCSPTCHGSEGW